MNSRHDPALAGLRVALRMRCCDAAVLVLRESKNPAVGSGDSGLCHMIAERAGMGHDGWWTEKKVLDNLSRQPGELVPR